jgi:NAD(P)-dependent dehydrogenase (short-subunit alcohol dehydrogenase family)
MKKVLITASTSPIGRVIADTFAKAGYQLVLHYHKDGETAEKLMEQYNGTVLLQADLSEPAGITTLISTLSEHAPFDVIVNNAGVSESGKEKDIAQWHRKLHINTIAPGMIMAHADKLVSSGGAIINISSIYGHERFGAKNFVIYDASKAALNSLTRTFAKRLAPRVRVNAVAPGYVDSAWTKDLSQKERADLAGEQLTGQFVTPHEVAGLVLHMVENRGFDGEVVYLDGGQTLKTV